MSELYLVICSCVILIISVRLRYWNSVKGPFWRLIKRLAKLSNQLFLLKKNLSSLNSRYQECGCKSFYSIVFCVQWEISLKESTSGLLKVATFMFDPCCIKRAVSSYFFHHYLSGIKLVRLHFYSSCPRFKKRKKDDNPSRKNLQ